MAELNVEIVAVERELWSGEATFVFTRTTAGEIGILPRHIPLVAQLVDDAMVRVEREGEDDLRIAVDGGFLSVTEEAVRILVGHQWDVARQDADLACSGAGEYERGITRPELALDGDDLDVQFSHVTPPFGVEPRSSQLGAEGFGLLRQVVEPADEEERLLGHVVELALGQLVERLDGLLERHSRTRLTGELLGRHHVLATGSARSGGPG